MNRRVERLRERSQEARPSVSAERSLLMTRVYREHLGKHSPPVLRALAFQRLCAEKTITIEPDELIVAVRFPVQSTRRVAFREVARRHGDFAMVAVAVCIENDNAMRIGVGGMADRPAVRRATIDGVADARGFFDSLAWELEGYDDTHASARLRRDLLRRVGPLVVEEALRCAA